MPKGRGDDQRARLTAESWNRETRRFLEGAFKVRLAIASALAVMLVVFYVWDPVKQKAVMLGVQWLLPV
jgi:hypothetical protein